VHSQDPNYPTIVNAAELSYAVYGNKIPTGYTVVENFNQPSLQATLYRAPNNDYILAFRGTDNVTNWLGMNVPFAVNGLSIGYSNFVTQISRNKLKFYRALCRRCYGLFCLFDLWQTSHWL